MIVPYQNLKLLHKPILKQLKNSFSKNLNESSFILGKDLLKFEKEFSTYCGTKYSIGVSNGSDAIFLALKVLNLSKGSEIILSSMTYISAAYSILFNDYKLVLCDIDFNTGLMDLNLLKKKISKKTKCIISTDLNGNVVNSTELKKIVKGKKIFLISDSSHAHGSFEYTKNNSIQNLRKAKKSGSDSDISCFSLYPGKNLGALGDAGIITTNNKNFYKKLLKLRNFGSTKKYYHESLGYNFKLDNIQASFLSIKLKKLDIWNKKKAANAKYYTKNITNPKIKLLTNSVGSSFYGFAILTNYRKKLKIFLDKKKIQTNIYYPFSINTHRALKKFFINDNFSQAEKFSKRSLVLPICSTLTKKQLEYVVKSVNSFK
tara:strand:+ start:1254 stop:2375 length:1122 start_codon:yes stop_codon:yes gene_type:complete